jgi:hypothetical protein
MPLKPEIKILALEMVQAWRSDSGLARNRAPQLQAHRFSLGFKLYWVLMLVSVIVFSLFVVHSPFLDTSLRKARIRGRR